MCILIFPSKIWAKMCTIYMAKYSSDFQSFLCNNIKPGVGGKSRIVNREAGACWLPVTLCQPSLAGSLPLWASWGSWAPFP